jgi:MATE family multidrug resistance protein
MLNRHAMEQLLLTALLGIWLFFVFDGIVWASVGVLTAAGDTLFIMLINSSTVWIFSIIPIYILTRYYGMSAQWIWFVIALYSFLNSLIFYYRYKKIKWQNVKSNLAR